jgi:hypothetical protein
MTGQMYPQMLTSIMSLMTFVVQLDQEALGVNRVSREISGQQAQRDQ